MPSHLSRNFPGWRVILMASNSKRLPLAATSFHAYELERGR
jgi:hypothetical protein